MIKKYALLIMSVFFNISLLASHRDFTENENKSHAPSKEELDKKIEELHRELAHREAYHEASRDNLENAKKALNDSNNDETIDDFKELYESEVTRLSGNVTALQKEISELTKHVHQLESQRHVHQLESQKSEHMSRKSSHISAVSTPRGSDFPRAFSEGMHFKEKTKNMTTGGHVRKKSSQSNNDDDDSYYPKSQPTSFSAASSIHNTPHKNLASEKTLEQEDKPLPPPFSFHSKQHSSHANNDSNKTKGTKSSGNH